MAVDKNSWLVNQPIAHRGLHTDTLPENSLGAFENAVKHNFPVEFDIHIIKDGTIVVFHDYDLNRICGADIALSNLTKTDLANYKLLGTQYTIPTLSEVLQVIGGKVPILIEFKAPHKKNKRLAVNANELLSKYKGEYAIESFNPFILFWYRKHNPKILRGQLGSFFEEKNASSPKGIKRLFTKRMSTNIFTFPDFVCYNKNDIPNKFVDRAKYAVICWTITDNDQFALINKDCDNFIFEGFFPANKEIS